MALIEGLEGRGKAAVAHKRLQRHRGQGTRRLCIENHVFRFLLESHDASHDRMNLDERWARWIQASIGAGAVGPVFHADNSGFEAA